MAIVAFDTLETLTRLKRSKAFTEKQAEVLVDILKETHDEVATKADIELIRRDMALMESRLFNKILAAQFATVGLFGAMKYFSH